MADDGIEALAGAATIRRYDCAGKAEPGEPVFILLGRDPAAFPTILEWCRQWQDAIAAGTRPPSDIRQVGEARVIAEQMRDYAIARRRRKSREANARNFPDLAAQGMHPVCPPEVRSWVQDGNAANNTMESQYADQQSRSNYPPVNRGPR